MTFEQRIRSFQEPNSPHSWPEHTIGHLVNAILSIHNAVDAKEFREGYIEWLRQSPDLDPRGPEFVTDSNIGWCFGEGMPEADRAMWRQLGASRPVFGAMRSNPTPQEAFQAGMDAIPKA